MKKKTLKDLLKIVEDGKPERESAAIVNIADKMATNLKKGGYYNYNGVCSGYNISCYNSICTGGGTIGNQSCFNRSC